jgi:hypothetical protein
MTFPPPLSRIADDFRIDAGSGPKGLHLNVAPRHIETFLAAAGALAEVNMHSHIANLVSSSLVLSLLLLGCSTFR